LITGNDHELSFLLKNNKQQEAKELLKKYIDTLGDTENILVELCYPLNNQSQDDIKKLNQKLVSLCDEFNLRYIASPAPRYLKDEDEEAFRVVLAIRDQVKLDTIKLTRDFKLPTKDELAKIFADFPESLKTEDLEQQVKIEISTDFDKNASQAYFPKFHLEEGQNAPDRLRWESYIGLFTRFHPEQKDNNYWKQKYPYSKLLELVEDAKKIHIDSTKMLAYPKNYWADEPVVEIKYSGQVSKSTGHRYTQDPQKITLKEKKTILDYIDRLEYELDIIIAKGYPDYFLVFGDIMRFCRVNGIVTNTRGSAAGSIVGYLNDIVVLDPLVYKLPFERFLNPLRPSPPDIDGDFADDRREEVIKYIKEKYGFDKVSQIITFGTMLPKAAVRDVGRVLGIAYSKCDKISKLIPNAPQGRKTSFKFAFETSKEVADIYKNDPDARRIIDIAKKIEGNYRHSSSHAAGVIITPTALTDYAPLQWDSEHKMLVVQYDMKYSEKAGLIKLDILGITNLAILGNAIAITKKRRKEDVDLLNIDVFNKKTFELLAKGRTMGTFQLSGPAMTRYLVDLEPTKVEDLMAMVALYRPGPMGSIPEYIARKKDPSKVTYLVPQMEGWMKESNGLLVYQDDLLYTAIYLAGYDWGEADKLRKGMGKKIQAVIDEQHPKFVQGCVEHSNLDKETAEYIWSLMVPFGAYGFNKAHSASYGMVAYWTAYMKALYPVEFMTAYMTSESNNLDKIAQAIQECKELGITVLPPDINKSEAEFSIENDNTIRYGFRSIKNLGNDVIDYIIKERQKNGEYKDFEDFLDRLAGCSGFNKRGIEALILSGSLDKIGQKVLQKTI
jgi:DNA polymerase-3 subunit alpha